jgi:hypothetical protein
LQSLFFIFFIFITSITSPSQHISCFLLLHDWNRSFEHQNVQFVCKSLGFQSASSKACSTH